MNRLDLKVGFQCNNRCFFCIQGDKRFSCPNKTDNEIKTILKRMRKNHEGVVFTGGEPTVRPELINWVSYAKELGYKVIQIQSNGRMFYYKKYCKDIVKAGANEFALAVHGSCKGIHEGLTQAPGSFLEVTTGIKNLKALNQYVLTNSVVTAMNYQDLPQLAKLLIKLKVDQFQFAFMHINSIIMRDPKLVNKIVPRYNKVMSYIKKGIDIGSKAGAKVMVEAVPYCFMKNYEKYISEQYIPFTSVIDDKIELADYGAYRKNSGKAKGPQCKNCSQNKICEGPWCEYPALFGWEEFKPIK